MLLACNIGNTNIAFGLFDENRKVFHSKIATVSEKTADEYAILLSGLLDMYHVRPDAIDGAVIASVVRPMNAVLTEAVHKLTGIEALQVGPGVKTGLNIKTEIPSQLGADIVANCVAAGVIAEYPQVVLSMGTATTITGMNARGELAGVMICPGLDASLQMLAAKTAELPKVALDKPKALLGRNTVDAMVSGVVHGHAAMIEGLLGRIKKDWDVDQITVVAGGAYAEQVLPLIDQTCHVLYEPDLTLLGLKRIYQLSRRRKNNLARESDVEAKQL